jgi:sugar lactone lactonase YvrE
MAEIKKTIHVRVLTFDPLQGKAVPVPSARLLCEDRGWLWDPDLSDGTHTTDANGLAPVEITFDDTKENRLNPFFTITIPVANRAAPSGAPADQQLTLPDQWVTRHYVNRRIPRIADHADPNNPLELYVGLPGRLRLAYSDFDPSGTSNPFALPESTVRVYLADYDDFLWIDFLNPDDTLKGFGANPNAKRIVSIGEKEEYPYFDTWPTAPSALDLPPADALLATPRAWLDPPGEPVGALGGGSFQQAGPVAVDPHGFVFMVDGDVVRRFYPDGTLAETIAAWPVGGAMDRFNGPGGLALDQYRNLFVADTRNDRMVIFTPDFLHGGAGTYQFAGTFGVHGAAPGQFISPRGMAVVPNRVVDGEEFLAVADSGNARVQVFTIAITASAFLSNRSNGSARPRLVFLNVFGVAGPGVGQFTEPVGVAADRQRRLFVCDRALHRVSRWRLDASVTPVAYVHETDWEKAGGGPGSGNREFNTPEAIAVDTKNGYVYAAESANRRVQRLDSDTGNHLTHWAPTYTPALSNPFTPSSVAVDARGEVYAADTANQRVVRGTAFDAAGAPLADGAVPAVVGAPWTPRDAPFHMSGPSYVYYGPDGRLWASDSGNNRVLGFERNASGEMVPSAAPPSTGLKPPATSLNAPVGVAVDPEGNLFVVDSGNHCVRRYDPSLAHQADLGTPGAGGSGANQFNNPRGIAIAQRVEPMLYVADRDNDRVQKLRRDGTFESPITAGGGSNLKKPEDVAVDSRSNLYVADTANGRVVQFDASDAFVRAFNAPSAGLGALPQPCGISVDAEDKLIVTDRAQNKVFRLEPDGALLASWDLRRLLRQNVSASTQYYPDLARLLVVQAPVRAVVDASGLLAIADTGHDRVRLVRVHTDLNVNLFDLGEGLPDISFRAATKADWTDDLGLAVNVGDVSVADDSHDFVSEPVEDFAQDRYEHRQVLGPARYTCAAINAMKVARMVQKWYKHHSRQADAAIRWGAREHARSLDIDLNTLEGSMYFLDVNLANEESGSPHGRGADAWDDSVVAHEMSHWVFSKNTFPYPILPLNPQRWIDMSGSHSRGMVTTHNQALSEGWAEYVEHFWGGEYSSVDRIRGFGMPTPGELTHVGEGKTVSGGLTIVNKRYVFDDSPQATPLPAFNAPGQGMRNEGYFANALYQIHRVLTDPGVLFADAPAYWYGYNVNISDEQSRRFSDAVWNALRRFKQDPPSSDRASEVFLVKLLDQIQTAQPAFAQIAQSIFELNNQLMPVITITEGTSTTAPGSAVGEEISIQEGHAMDFIVQVKDATGRPLTGHHLHIQVGSSADYTLVAGTGPTVRHGGRPPSSAPPSTADIYRATYASGIVNIRYTAPAGPASRRETMQVTYQPDFDTDDTFSPPEKGDDRETTLRRLYLYELRAAAKVWPGAGNNFGAKVSTSVTFNIVPP